MPRPDQTDDRQEENPYRAPGAGRLLRCEQRDSVDAHFPTIDEPATPDYVLGVLRDEHRQACQFDPEVDPQASLSFESTVAEWREACDLLGWRQLGRAYNEHWGINVPDAEWYAVLEPSRHKRLADVCSLIARHISRPRIHAAHILGRACLPAGAFLTIRSLLQQAGACADEIARLRIILDGVVNAMKFSLLTLLGVVAIAAVGCAALSHPAQGSAIAVVTGGILLLFGAALAAIYCKAATRAFWTGFVILGWGYLLLVWICFENELAVGDLNQILATTWVLNTLGEATIGEPYVGIERSGADGISFRGVGVEQSLEWMYLLQIGHALWAILFAFAGGVLARWLYLRRDAMSLSIGVKGIQAPKESS